MTYGSGNSKLLTYIKGFFIHRIFFITVSTKERRDILIKHNVQFRDPEEKQKEIKKIRLYPVFRIRIRIRIRIHVFFGLPDPDPLVRGMDPDPSIIMQK